MLVGSGIAAGIGPGTVTLVKADETLQVLNNFIDSDFTQLEKSIHHLEWVREKCPSPTPHWLGELALGS